VSNFVELAEGFTGQDGQSKQLLEALESAEEIADTALKSLGMSRQALLQKFVTRATEGASPAALPDDLNLLKAIDSRIKASSDSESRHVVRFCAGLVESFTTPCRTCQSCVIRKVTKPVAIPYMPSSPFLRFASSWFYDLACNSM
jgi:hypothetical protein